MARVFALTNNKGGVGKSSNAINFAAGLAEAGNKVLLIDTDPQSNSSWTILNQIRVGEKQNLYDVLINKKPLHESIRPTRHPNLFVVRSTIKMSFAEVQLFSESYREQRLRIAIKPYLKHFDYILIDTPPNLGMLTVNALTASTDIIIPLTLSEYALVGISILLNAIKTLKLNALANDQVNDINESMRIFGVVVTMARNTKDSQEHIKRIREYFQDLVLEPFIPLNVKVEEANNPRNDAFLYRFAPSSPGAVAYNQLVQAILTRVEASTNDPEAYAIKSQKLLDEIPEEIDEEED